MIEHMERDGVCGRCAGVLVDRITRDDRPHTICPVCQTGRLHTHDGTPHGRNVYVRAA